MRYSVFLVLLVFFSIFGVHVAENCNKSPQCICQFDADGELPVAGSGSDGQLIGIAGAIGALGSMVVAGGGFAVWRCINSRSASTSNLYGRPASNDSSIGSWMNEKGKDPLTPRNNLTRGSTPFSLQDDDEFGGNHTSGPMSSSRRTNIYRNGPL